MVLLNVTPNITRSSDSFCTVPPIVNAGDLECIVHDLKTMIVLVTRIQFHPLKVTLLTHLDGVTAQRLCYSHSKGIV